MLCTRMQLTERRLRIKSSISYQNGDGDYESRATVSSESRSPFVRPCAILKMFDNDSVNGKESTINSSRSSSSSKSNKKTDVMSPANQTDAHGSQTNLEK